jgi:hypothetical protein
MIPDSVVKKLQEILEIFAEKMHKKPVCAGYLVVISLKCRLP